MREIDPTGLEQSYTADTRRANRRRLGVFLGVFLVVAIAGLVWDFSRPAEYRATARLQITPAVLTVAAGNADVGSANSTQQFFTEVQTLSSRPLLEQVAEGLRSAGHDLASLGLDPILALQSALVVTAVENTQVVELVATGREPELPAALLAGIVDVYETVDRTKLANEIARRAPGARVLVQVDTTGEPGKGGVPIADLDPLVEHVRSLDLDLVGLMTVGPTEGGPAAAAPGFRQVRAAVDRLGLSVCSMGMTADIEVAVAEGSTEVRVGTALFGPRSDVPTRSDQER